MSGLRTCLKTGSRDSVHRGTSSPNSGSEGAAKASSALHTGSSPTRQGAFGSQTLGTVRSRSGSRRQAELQRLQAKSLSTEHLSARKLGAVVSNPARLLPNGFSKPAHIQGNTRLRSKPPTGLAGPRRKL